MAAERAAQLDAVADSRHLVEIGRDLALGHQLDRHLVDPLRAPGREVDRIAALGLVAVGRGEAEVEVLAGGEGPCQTAGRKAKTLIRGVSARTASIDGRLPAARAGGHAVSRP